MSDTEVMPGAQAAAADQPAATQAADPNAEGQTKVEGEGDQAKPEKTETELRMEQLERENKRMQRGIDRRTRQLAEARAQIGLTRETLSAQNTDTDENEPLSLTRAELAKFVKAEAEKLAPTLGKQALEVEKQRASVQSLLKDVGQDKFQELTDELAEVFDGPKQLAVLGAENPAALLKYLTDPANADESEEIGRLSAIDAGRRLARIEAKLAAESPKEKSKVSKAPEPLGEIRSQGAAQASMQPDPKNTRAWMAWRNEQERKGLA